MEVKCQIIEGYPDYAITNDGRVYNLKRKRYMKGSINNHGYRYFDLSYGEYGNRMKRKRNLHRLMALAFIPNPDNKPCVCHKDDDPSNNTLDNLYWGTYSDNTLDALVNFNLVSTTRKLSDDQVRFIRTNTQFNTVELAAKYGVTDVVIGNVRRFKTYKGVK